MEHIAIPLFDEIYPVSEHMDVAKLYIDTVFKFITTTDSINIWCRGSSGSILATLLYIKLDRNDIVICHVKKEEENSHSRYPTPKNNSYNLIIDDFISTGETVNSIYSAMDGFTVDCLIVLCGFNNAEIKFTPKTLITNLSR